MTFHNDSKGLQAVEPIRDFQIQKEFENGEVPVIAIPNLPYKFQLLLPNHCSTY